MSSPAKKKSVFSPSPSKKARTGEKPSVKFLAFNQNTYKSGLVFLKFDQGSISDDLREGLKKLKDQGKFIVSFNSGKRRGRLLRMVRLSPSSSTHERATLLPPINSHSQGECELVAREERRPQPDITA
jgi:hypothetical protein